MKKSISLIFVLVLSAMMLFSACEKNVELAAPEFQDTKEIVIGAWSGSVTKWDQQQFSNLEAANINLLVATSESYIQYNNDFFDRAYAAGVSVMPDSRQWNGRIPSYMEHPAFAGYCVWDEPARTAFEGLGEKKALWDSVMGDKTFFINVFPGWAGSALGGSFKSYISSYIETVKPELLCFDHYPLLENSMGETVVRDTFFSDMDICSHYAKEAGIPFWYTLLTSGHMSYVTPSAEEIRWQMAVGQAYGATGLLHYVYGTHDGDYTAPIDWDTQATTEVYDAMKQANLEVASWDHIYMNFDWQGTAAIGGNNNAVQSTGFQLCQFHVDPTENTGITGIESSEDLLCGIFKDSSGREAFMLTNATNPAEGKNATVKLTLDAKYKGILIIDCGEQTTTRLEKNKATIEVASSKGVFVIPLTAK